jgi:hypothetical protein
MPITSERATVGLAFCVATLAGAWAAATLGADGPRPPQLRVDQHAQTSAAAVTFPSFPDAITQPPRWLEKDVPFDLAAFFASPPPKENAAPLYLEALFEFDSGMAVCFREGADRESRKLAAMARSSHFGKLAQSLRTDPSSVPAAALDAVIDEYEMGFRKLDLAQTRPQCVFSTGLSITTALPHMQAARQVARIAEWKVRRELDRGEIDAALRDLARVLRLSRDLLPRGTLIVGLVSSAMDVVAVKVLATQIVGAPGLTVGECDRLLALAIEHDTRAIDGYTEGLRAEYLLNRQTLHDLIFDQPGLRARWGARIGDPIGPSSSIVAEIAEPMVSAVLAKDTPGQPPRGELDQQLDALAEQIVSLKNVRNLDARIAATTDAQLAGQVAKLNELYRALLGAARGTELERIRISTERPRSLDTPDLLTRVTCGILPAFTAFVQSRARSKALIRALEGLVLVRRWQIRHGERQPPSLEAAAKEAGLPAALLDPYDDRPIRFAIVDGQPTVYAVGQDGRDDGGTIDNSRTPDSGDVLLRLPKS